MIKNRTFFYYLLLFLLTISARLLFAQDQDIKFEKITIKEGLSENTVYSISQDDHGFMWFGTQDGLNKFDGYKVSVFSSIDKLDSLHISDNWINKIKSDSVGNMYIATNGGGLNVYNIHTKKFFYFIHKLNDEKTLGSNRINTFIIDSKNTLWVGTNNGLDKYDPVKGEFIHYKNDPTDANSLADNSIKALYEDKKGNLWIGTEFSGLDLFDRETGIFVHYTKSGNSEGLSSNFVKCIYEDSKGDFWIGTNHGLNLMDRENGKFIHYFNNPSDKLSISADNINTIYETKEKFLLIGTNGGGLNILNRQQNSFHAYKYSPIDPYSISSNTIWEIAEDRQGKIWIGTSKGVNVIYKLKFTAFADAKPTKSGLSDSHVLSLYCDKNNVIWVGTNQGGLNRISPDRAQFKVYNKIKGKRNSLSSNTITAITQDLHGNLWLGTANGGLDRFDVKGNKSLHFVNDPENYMSLSSNTVYCTYMDSEGTLWIGTDKGLNRFDERSGLFQRYEYLYQDSTSLSNNHVQCIFEDSEKNLWIGTYGGGLNLFNRKDQTFKRFQKDPSNKYAISSNRVRVIYEGNKGVLWIGTDNGLNKFIIRENTFIKYDMKNGLPNNVINGILSDIKGLLWISTNRGIFSFAPLSGEIKTFDVSDGLQGFEFSPGACSAGPKGNLLFGGISGLNEFYPNQIKLNHDVPPILLTSFKVFGKEYDFGKSLQDIKSINLSYKQNFITFEFAILDYLNNDKKEYAYMLEGFDNDWNNIGSLNHISYSNLDGGDYVFKVRAANNDGFWNNKGISLNVHIEPPFWNKWWFRIIMGLIIISSVYSYYYRRINSVKRQREFLRKQADERLVELRASNKKLLRAQQDLKRRAKLATSLYEIGRRISGELELEPLLAQLVKSSYESFGYYGVMILLRDDSENVFKLRAIAGGYADIFPADLTIKENEGMIGKAATAKKIQISGDVTKDPNYVRKAGEITKSEMCIPIISGNNVLGVLDLQSVEKNAFSDADISAVEMLSTQVATAINNARLFEKAQHEIKEREKAEADLIESHNEVLEAKKEMEIIFEELQKSHAEILDAKNETDLIFQNVEEGLFLLSSDGKIGSQYSASLKKMFNVDDLQHHDFLALLKDKIDEKTEASAEEYLELMFKKEIEESMLNELNPLTDVEFSFSNKVGVWTHSSYYSFKFKRIIEDNGDIEELIVTVVDVTDEKKLKDQLEETEVNQKRQMDWLLSILHVEPELLQDFIESAQSELDFMENTLKSSRKPSEYRSVLKKVYRSVHLVKGNASLLDLKYFINFSKVLEDKITKIERNEKISGMDFLSLVMDIDEGKNVLHELTDVIKRIGKIQENFRPKRDYEKKLFIQTLENYINGSANEENKKVDLIHDQFDSGEIPYRYRLVIKEVLIELIKNSIYNSIETIEERQERGKKEAGTIYISTEKIKNRFIVKYRDDGRGIPAEELKKKAIETKVYTKNELDTWDKKKLASLIFNSELYGLDSKGIFGNRSMNMETIKMKLRRHSGTILLDSSGDNYFEFIIELPIKEKIS